MADILSKAIGTKQMLQKLKLGVHTHNIPRLLPHISHLYMKNIFFLLIVQHIFLKNYELCFVKQATVNFLATADHLNNRDNLYFRYDSAQHDLIAVRDSLHFSLLNDTVPHNVIAVRDSLHSCLLNDAAPYDFMSCDNYLFCCYFWKCSFIHLCTSYVPM